MPAPARHVLFICTGNICRSPMAEALFRKLAEDRPDWTASSAGVSAATGQPASPEAVDVLAAEGMDLRSFRSQPVTEELLKAATDVYVMTSSHRNILDIFYPEHGEKIRLLREFAGGGDVPDPIARGHHAYVECLGIIRIALKKIIEHLKAKGPMKPSPHACYAALAAADPAVAEAIAHEEERQSEHIELIASENFTSRAVREAQGSCLTNKYAEGYPGRRWYGGCEHVDVVESLAVARARELFHAEHVNVQPHSGSQANMAVYFSVLQPGDRILTMDLSHGGHLTHGHKANFSGKLYEVHHYGVSRETETIDYDALARHAREVRPRMITAGASAYSRVIDFARMREIADSVGAYLFVDMAHIAGLVAGGVHPSPMPHAHFVTTTTHKSLRGPRGGIILCREEFAKKIDAQTFPCIQGGPLMHVIAAKAVCLHEALQPGYRAYARQVVNNAQALAARLTQLGWRIVSGGTDNHLMLVDVRGEGVTGVEAQTALDKAAITVNKNAIPFDTEPITKTGGIRLGSPAATTRGLLEDDFMQVAEFVDEAIRARNDDSQLAALRTRVTAFNKAFPLP